MATRSLGSLTIDLIAKIAGFEQGMDKASRTADKRMREIEKSVKRAGAFVGTALAGAVTMVGVQVNKLIKDGQQISVLSRLSGESAERFQEWAVGAQTVGVEQEKLADILKDTQDKVGDFLQTGGGAMADFFEQIAPKVGVTAENFRRLSGRDALQLYAESLQKANVSQAEMAFYMEAVASDSTKLYPLLMNNGEGFEYWAKHARDAGAIMDGETLEATRRLDVEMKKMRLTIDGLWKESLAGLLPDLEDLAKLLNSREFRDGFGAIIKGAVEATRVLAQLATTTANVTKFLGEEVAARVHGAASDDIIRLEQEAERIQKKLSSLGSGAAADIWDAGREMLGLPTTDQLRKRLGDIYTMIENYKPPKVSIAAPTFDPANVDQLQFGSGNIRVDPKDAAKASREAAERLKEQQRAREELERQIQAVVDARAEFDAWAAQLAGPIADANHQYALDLERLNQLAATGEVSTDDLRLAQERLRKEHELNIEAIEARLEPGKQMLKDLEFELALLKMTNAERATAIQLRGMDAEQVRKYGDAIADANRRIEEEMESARWMDGIRYEFQGFFEDVLNGTESIEDAFRKMLANISAQITSRIVEGWVEQLFGAMGTSSTGSSGGFWAALGSIFGGGKASGGWASPHSIYEVNERGMEMATVNGRDYLLTGSSPVRITPNHMLGGGRQVNVTQQFINPVLADRRSDTQRAAESGRKIREAARNS